MCNFILIECCVMCIVQWSGGHCIPNHIYTQHAWRHYFRWDLHGWLILIITLICTATTVLSIIHSLDTTLPSAMPLQHYCLRSLLATKTTNIFESVWWGRRVRFIAELIVEMPIEWLQVCGQYCWQNRSLCTMSWQDFTSYVTSTTDGCTWITANDLKEWL